MKAFLSVLFIAVCLFGCKKSNVTPPSIAGTWELRNVINGTSNSDSTYNSGNGNVYKFNSDNTYSKYKNDTVLIASGNYKINTNAQKVSNVYYNTITFDGNGSASQIIQVANNTLTLGLTYSGGTAFLYAKLF